MKRQVSAFANNDAFVETHKIQNNTNFTSGGLGRKWWQIFAFLLDNYTTRDTESTCLCVYKFSANIVSFCVLVFPLYLTIYLVLIALLKFLYFNFFRIFCVLSYYFYFQIYFSRSLVCSFFRHFAPIVCTIFVSKILPLTLKTGRPLQNKNKLLTKKIQQKNKY